MEAQAVELVAGLFDQVGQWKNVVDRAPELVLQVHHRGGVGIYAKTNHYLQLCVRVPRELFDFLGIVHHEQTHTLADGVVEFRQGFYRV